MEGLLAQGEIVRPQVLYSKYEFPLFLPTFQFHRLFLPHFKKLEVKGFSDIPG